MARLLLATDKYVDIIRERSIRKRKRKSAKAETISFPRVAQNAPYNYAHAGI